MLSISGSARYLNDVTLPLIINGRVEHKNQIEYFFFVCVWMLGELKFNGRRESRWHAIAWQKRFDKLSPSAMKSSALAFQFEFGACQLRKKWDMEGRTWWGLVRQPDISA